MANMIQTPAPGDFLLRWRGDALTVTLKLDVPRPGRAAFRTNLGNADVRRQEIIDATEKGLTPLARAWSDIPLPEVAPGVFRAVIPLDEVGIFSGKACFFADGDAVAQLHGDEEIVVEKAAATVPLVELPGTNPFAVLSRKLGWSGSRIQ